MFFAASRIVVLAGSSSIFCWWTMSGTTFRCMLSSGSQAFPAGLPAGYVASAKRRDWSLVATNCARLANRGQAGHGAKLRQVWHASRRISAYSTVGGAQEARSEEHTSELQSLMRISYAVF